MSNTVQDLLNQLRQRAKERLTPTDVTAPQSWGDKAADTIAEVVGSWRFIAIQSALLFAWIVFNATSADRVDPYPFILLNLMLSFQAAYTAPVIMMSQNRQDSKDRLRGELDYDVNRRAEAEIQGLARKLNALQEQVGDITELLRRRQ